MLLGQLGCLLLREAVRLLQVQQLACKCTHTDTGPRQRRESVSLWHLSCQQLACTWTGSNPVGMPGTFLNVCLLASLCAGTTRMPTQEAQPSSVLLCHSLVLTLLHSESAP